MDLRNTKIRINDEEHSEMFNELPKSKCKVKVLVTGERYSVELCDNHPKYLFVFGDNTQRYGRGGQATIRYCQNSFGIATKREPNYLYTSFFNDAEEDYLAVKKDLHRLTSDLNSGEWDAVVFSAGGVGTGLADMTNRSPKLFKRLCEHLQSVYGFDNNI